MTKRFRNRTEAGQRLASKLKNYANRLDVLVLGLPRGGVPVAFEVAKALNAPLDICLVRKLGVPGYKELAMGAIALGGVQVVNYDVVSELGISSQTIDSVAATEQKELERRERVYRGNRTQPDVSNRTIILVDDGIATGSTMRAAIAVIRQQQPQQIIVAVPVACEQTCEELKTEVDKVVCLIIPENLYAVALWYENFEQTTDKEVHELLAKPMTISHF
jgi:putative phosphoribosyl transferase